jgi:murein biosynthesis integral membrane protein MurJ
MIKHILFSTLVINLGLLLGRLSGFIRESFVAATFGVSSQADVTLLMLTVPDLLVNILVGGAMGAVLIPEFKAKPDFAKKLLFQVAVFFGVLFTIVSAFLYLNSFLLVEVFAPGFEGEKKLKASTSLSWVIWLVPLTVLAGITTAFLHSKEKFAIASLGTLIMNSSIISGLLFVQFGLGSVYWVALFVLLGGFLRLSSQVFFVGLKWAPISSFDSILLSRKILYRYVGAIFSGSILLIIPVLVRAFSSFLGEGSLAVMNYSSRLIEFPLAIAITVLSVSLFPKLSESFLDNRNLYKNLVGYGSQAILGISILIMITLLTLSSYYIDVIFNYGNMKDEDLIAIEQVISIGLFVLPLQGMAVFLSAVFYSQKNTKTPLIVNFLGLVVFYLTYTSNAFGFELSSIMMSMVCGYGFIFLLQIFLVKIDGEGIFHLILKSEFLTGLVFSSILLYLLISILDTANYNPFLTILLAILIGLLSLFSLAMFNCDFRLMIKKRVPLK